LSFHLDFPLSHSIQRAAGAAPGKREGGDFMRAGGFMRFSAPLVRGSQVRGTELRVKLNRDFRTEQRCKMNAKWMLLAAMGAGVAGLGAGCESDGSDEDPAMMGQIVGNDGRVYQDTDGDGRRDAMDAAPYNPRDNRRARDADSDGVRDMMDANDRSNRQNRNYRDTDRDGTIDSEDRFPRDPRAH
jgi:hypothetical protein